jgi:hypothetical protein
MSIPDNYDIWCYHQAEKEKAEARLPVCCHCDKHIGDDFLYYIEGDIYCEECMTDEFRRPTDDFIDEGE